MAQVSVLMPPNQTVYEGDCIVDGIDYRLVKEGLYEAVLTSYETSTRFCKKGKDSKIRDGGKIYFHFHIDPYNNAGLGKEKMIVFMAFNAKQIILPAGKNGKFKVGARTNYVKLFVRKSVTLRSYDETTKQLHEHLSLNVRPVGDFLS